MIELKLEHIEKLEKILGNTPKQIPIVLARAINRSAESARTSASRSARETYIIKHRDVISTIKIKKANPNDLRADIKSRGSAIKLINFRVKPNKPQPKRKSPISISVKRGSSKSIKNGFVAQMKKSSGHVNVFSRLTRKRMPIKGHYGPSIPQMLGNESVIKYVENKAGETLDTRVVHELKRLLGGTS